tara:strand:+ start:902 stop:2032 length:1131 start_codon:yes stop_codon:yes gene_type:complete
MKKILLLTWTPFFKSDYKRYNLDILEKKNKIIIFDISQILFKNFNLNKIYKKKDRIKSQSFLNIKKFIIELKNIDIDLVINATGLERNKSEWFGKKYNIIFDTLLEKDIKIVSIIDFKIIESLFLKRKIVSYVKYIIKYLKIIFYTKQKNDVTLIGSENIDNKLKCLGRNVFYSHSFCYDYFLRERKKIITKKKTVMFIDTGYGFHPDFFLSRGINKSFDINNYSKKINFLFKSFNDLGFKVYFLSHPKVKKEKQKIYKNCTIIHNNTNKYIRISDIVVTTTSSTLDFAIIYKKKILRVFSSEIEAYPENARNFKLGSKFFDNKFLDLDDLSNLKKKIFENILRPGALYKKYFDIFIKHPKSHNMKFSEIIISFLK